MSRSGHRKKIFYKYKAFNHLLVEMILEDQIFFADPKTFNDPLDTRPSLDTDIPAEALEAAFLTLAEKRLCQEMRAGAKAARFKGEKLDERIQQSANAIARSSLADIRYNATNPEIEASDPLQFLLGHAVEEELLRQYERGIFCLASRSDCPLMWSHYADQHHGLCIGYSIPEDQAEDLFKVEYGGSPRVKASDVASMLAGGKDAARRVNAAVLLRKAAPWKYEREWRLFGPRGPRLSMLEIEEVIFGMRCSDAVKYAVLKALGPRRKQIRFYEMGTVYGTFRLRKRPLNDDELLQTYPHRSRAYLEWFTPVDEEETP